MKLSLFRLHVCALLIILAGCGGAEQNLHRTTALKPLQTYLDYYETQDEVSVRAKLYTVKDAVNAFGEQGKRLLRNKKPLYPIQLSITNHSDQIVILKPSNISIPLVPYRVAAARMQKNSALYAFGAATSVMLTAATIFTGGLCALALGFIATSMPLLIFGGATAAVGPLLLIIGTPVAASIKSSRIDSMNSALKKDVKEKIMRDTILIDPQHTIDVLLFAERKYVNKPFTVNLIHKNFPYQPTSFTIDVKPEIRTS